MNEEIIFKRMPAFEYLKINIDGNPLFLENTAQLSTSYGEGEGVAGCLLTWDFKVYEGFISNQLLIDSRISHEHKFKKFSGLTLHEIEEVVAESHNEARHLLHFELKKDNVEYLASDLPSDYLQGSSQDIFAELSKILYL